MNRHPYDPSAGWSPQLGGPRLHLPLAWPFLLLLAGLLAVLVLALQFGILAYAYERLGLDPVTAVLLLVGSILGSGINIPVARVPIAQHRAPDKVVSFLGVRYVIPRPWVPSHTVVAVNVGGALIPAGVAGYLVVHDSLDWRALVAAGVVAVFVHVAARPVAGAGIVVPGLLPAAVAAAMGYLLGGHSVAATAYFAGVIGTLVGADLMNLNRVAELEAPVVSIGGAGTFDGVFLTGIVAVLLAAL